MTMLLTQEQMGNEIMKDYLTIREAAESGNLNKSPAWIRAGIRLGKIKAERLGPKLFILHRAEVERIKDNPITISRQEMFG